MNRHRLAFLCLLTLVVAAGCSTDYQTGIEVVPDVEDATFLPSGEYQINVSLRAPTADATRPVTDVTVYGYTLDGRLVCSIDFGNVSGDRLDSTRCDAFPSLLISDSPDRRAMIPSGDNWSPPDAYEVRMHLRLYQGFDNGTHRFGWAGTLGDALERNEIVLRDGTPVPTPGKLQSMKCRQWRLAQNGRNYSALQGPTWLDWERRRPNTTRAFEITFSNYTHLRRIDASLHEDLDAETYRHDIDEVPLDLREYLARDIEFARNQPVDRSKFFEIVGQLSNRELNHTDDLEAAFPQLRGPAGQYDNTEIDCHANPPRYIQNRGRWAKLLVTDGNITWVVSLRTREQWSGRAFVNDTTAKSG